MVKARAALTMALLGASLTMAATGPAAAHHSNDWGVPLIGGALGGYALGSFLGGEKQPATQPVHQAPPPQVEYVPVQAAPVRTAPAPQPANSTASIEARLKQLDTLAAGGYITPQEYQARRAQILNSL